MEHIKRCHLNGRSLLLDTEGPYCQHMASRHAFFLFFLPFGVKTLLKESEEKVNHVCLVILDYFSFSLVLHVQPVPAVNQDVPLIFCPHGYFKNATLRTPFKMKL